MKKDVAYTKETKLIILKHQAIRLARALIKDYLQEDEQFEDVAKAIEETKSLEEIREIVFGKSSKP